MADETSDRRKVTNTTTELDPTKQIQAFVSDHPLLSLAFMRSHFPSICCQFI